MLNREDASDRHDAQSCCIQFPVQWQQPRFHLGQKVYPSNTCDRSLFWGQIRGIHYALWNESWIYTVATSRHCELLTNAALDTDPEQNYAECQLRLFDEA